MVVTMHCIDGKWKLQSSVLKFCYLPPPHDEYTTFESILSVLKEYNVATKIKTITSDSGSEMSPATGILRRTLNDEYGRHFDDEAFHIRGVCHIINRAVVDATSLIRKEVDMLPQLLKVVRGSIAIRVIFF